jgi:WD40 repeat protein
VLQHNAQVGSAAFSPDGERIVSTVVDGTALVWDADGSGEPLILSGHDGRLTRASFSPDGTRIVTAATDGTARVWLYTADRLKQVIASRTRGCLDPTFRESYLDESPAAARRAFERCERRHGRGA